MFYPLIVDFYYVLKTKINNRYWINVGVESISIDPKQGLVTVSGKVNPMALVKFIQKMGQRAELWSFQKAPMKAQNYHCCHHHNHSNTDSSDDDSLHGGTTHWEHPQCQAMNRKRSKKNKGWKERLGFKFGNYFVEPKSWIASPRRPTNFPAPPPIAMYNPFMGFHRSTPPMYARATTPYGGSSNLMQRFINPMVNYGSYADNYRYTI